MKPPDRKLALTKKFFETYKNIGFKSITMDDLSREFGISKKTIYQYFANKEEVIEQVVEYYIHIIKSSFPTVHGRNPMDELINFFRVIINNPKDVDTIFFQSLDKSYRLHHRRLAEFASSFFTNQLEKIIHAGIEHQYLHNHIDLNAFTKGHLSLLSSFRDLNSNPEYYTRINAEEYFVFVICSIRGICADKGLKYLSDIRLTSDD